MSDRLTEASSTRTTTMQSLRSLVELHDSSRWPLIGLLVLGAVSGLTEALALVLFVRAALAVTGSGSPDISVAGVTVGADPGWLFLIAIGLTLVTIGTHTLLTRGTIRLALSLLVGTRMRLIEGFNNASWAYQSSSKEGELQETTTSVAQRTSGVYALLIGAAASLTILVAILAAAIIIAPAMTLLMIGVIAVVLMALQPLTRSTQRRSSFGVHQTAQLAEEVAASTTLAREVRTFGVGRRRTEHIAGVVHSSSKGYMRARASNTLASYLFKDLALLALISMVGLLYLLVDLTATATTAVVLLLVRALGYLQMTYSAVQRSAEDSGAVRRLVEQIDELEATADSDGSTRIDGIGAIQLSSVGFEYPNRDGGGAIAKSAVTGIDLTIEPGSTTGVVGASGAGKTTIAELLLRLRRPTTGSITVAGIDLNEIAITDWARLVAFVPQDPRLTAHSVTENIRFFRPEISDADVRRAAVDAHIADTIDALPDGFDTVMGSRSQGLSGGQRQRIAIARALAGQPQLLILDEPTSALDHESERLFTATLDELKGTTTILVIAHRASTLEACDTVVTVTDGRIEPTAPPTETGR